MTTLEDIVAAYQADRRADGLPPDPAPFAATDVALDKPETIRHAHRKLALRLSKRLERPVNLPVSEIDSVHEESLAQAEKAVK